VAAYHGGLETARREHIEDALRRNALKAVVATSALGMGYDKPDLAFCIHVGSPASPVAYYQQVGRAGRALDEAVAVLLPAETDERIWAYFATSGVPDEQRVGKVIEALGQRPQTLLELENSTAIRRGRLEGLLKILAVDDVVQRSGSAWALTGTPWTFDAERWQALAQVRGTRSRPDAFVRRGAGLPHALFCRKPWTIQSPTIVGVAACAPAGSRAPAPGPEKRVSRRRASLHAGRTWSSSPASCGPAVARARAASSAVPKAARSRLPTIPAGQMY
jgi:ATP-dependent DNA helicase RecQ